MTCTGRRQTSLRDISRGNATRFFGFLPAGCTDVVEPNNAGCGRRLNVAVGQQLDQWLEHDENLAKSDPNGRTVSERRVLLTRWLAAVIEEIDADAKYRFRLFETWTAMTTDGSGDDCITLDGLSAPYSFMNVDFDSSSEGAGGDGGAWWSGAGWTGGAGRIVTLARMVVTRPGSDRKAVPAMKSVTVAKTRPTRRTRSRSWTTMTTCQIEIVLGMDIPVGVRLQVSPLPALDQFLVKRGVLVRFGLGWFGRVMTRRAHRSSWCEYDYRVVLHADGSTKKREVAIGVVQH